MATSRKTKNPAMEVPVAETTPRMTRAAMDAMNGMKLKRSPGAVTVLPHGSAQPPTHIHPPAAYLEEAVKVFSTVANKNEPLLQRRLPAWMTRFNRAIVVQLLPTLALRVRDPKSGQILAESEPGDFGILTVAYQGRDDEEARPIAHAEALQAGAK